MKHIRSARSKLRSQKSVPTRFVTHFLQDFVRRWAYDRVDQTAAKLAFLGVLRTFKPAILGYDQGAETALPLEKKNEKISTSYLQRNTTPPILASTVDH